MNHVSIVIRSRLIFGFLAALYLTQAISGQVETKTESFDGSEVWKGRLLLTTPREMLESEEKKLEKGLRDENVPAGIVRFNRTNTYLLQTLNGQSTRELFDTLKIILGRADILGQDVSHAVLEPDYIVRASRDLDSNVEVEGCPDGSTWGPTRIHAGEAWNEVSRIPGQETIVAVLDHGYADHPDLQANLWSAPGPFNISMQTDNGTLLQAKCPEGTHGINFTAKSNAELCSAAETKEGHGTKVAGIIGANGGITGINKNTKILPIKVLNSGSDTDQGILSATLKAWEFIAEINRTFYSAVRASRGIVVVNHSYGFKKLPNTFTALIESISTADKEGLLLVAAAGNNYRANIGEDFELPASINSPNIIAVSSTDEHDNIEYFSSVGSTTVDVAAPGKACTTSINKHYAVFNNTSAAAAFVSGAASLVLSACPNLRDDQIKNYLEKKAFNNNGLLRSYILFGRIDASASVKSCRAKEIVDFDRFLPQLSLLLP